MEQQFSQLTLDVIGLAVFNYNFDSLTADSPVIESVYTALKEAEARSTDLLPYWKAGFITTLVRLLKKTVCLTFEVSLRDMLIFCLMYFT